MRYLVTGGAGFIGSHLVDRLLKDSDNHVIVLDDFSEGKWENLPSIKTKNMVVFGGSILDDNSFIYEKIDTVFHLAALTRPRESMFKPEEFTRINVDGTVRVLKNCRDNNVKRVVFMSSAATYGHLPLPLYEGMIQDPASPYALTKVVGESYCKLFQKLYGLNINCIRPFNVYGPRQNPHGGYAGAVPKFIDTLKEGGKPFITGDGNQVRDFVYIDDVVDLILLAAGSEISGEVFNAGSGKNISINDLYSVICELMGKKVTPEHVLPMFEPETLADISKAEKMLGWKPKFPLEEGLKRTIDVQGN